ncbi:MAG: PIN domain-containing protein [Pseudomonadota bacterium]|nr:PIN domain-containing protein [Pseudomonadota bacterium]
MTSAILFVDTNGFIQVRDLKDIPWRDLFPGVKHVRIMVAKPVIEELGKHKTSNSDRRRNRARLALNLIAEASKAPDRTLTLKNKPVAVTLEIPRIKRPDWEALDALDPSSNDDRLVAAAVTYGHDAAVFSHDTGPRIGAHDHGLNAYEPLEDWLLEPEPSDDQRKIGELQRQLKQALSTKPELSIEIDGRDPSGKLTLYRPIVPPLASEAVDRIVNRYLAEYPRGSPSAAHPLLAVSGQYLTSNQVDRYHDDFDGFEERARNFFQRLHEQLPFWVAVPIVRVTTMNKGSVSATNFHVTLETSDGIELAAEASDIRKMCPFPKPPKEPEPRGLYNLSRHDFLEPINLKEPHPTKMVWIDRPKLGDTFGQYGCKDFQPNRTHEKEVVLWQIGELPVTGILTVTAGANDVADISESVEVVIEEREAEWHSPLVVESMPEFLRTELPALKLGPQTREKMKKIGAKVKAITKQSAKFGAAAKTDRRRGQGHES